MNDMSNNISVNSLDKEATLIYKLIDTLILDMVEQPIKKHATTKVKQTCGDDSTGTYGYSASHRVYLTKKSNDSKL